MTGSRAAVRRRHGLVGLALPTVIVDEIHLLAEERVVLECVS